MLSLYQQEKMQAQMAQYFNPLEHSFASMCEAIWEHLGFSVRSTTDKQFPVIMASPMGDVNFGPFNTYAELQAAINILLTILE